MHFEAREIVWTDSVNGDVFFIFISPSCALYMLY